MVNRRGESGLTLVELLVTLVVASLVASSTFVFFAGQKSVYETQTKLLNVQQNLWAATETLTVNLRAAGSAMVGCVRPDSDAAGPDTGDPPPVGAIPPLTGMRMWVNNPAPTGYIPNAMNRIAPIWIQNGIGALPDTLTIAYGVGSSGNFTDASGPTGLAAAVTTCDDPVTLLPGVPPTTDMFRAPAAGVLGEFFLLVHNTSAPPSLNKDRGCTLFNITGIAGNTLLKANTSFWNTTGACPGMFTWGAPPVAPAYTAADSGVRNFGQLRWIRFAILPDAAGVPNLTLDRLDIVNAGVRPGPQVLAEGIENMQIAFGCDLGAAGGAPPDGIITEDLVLPTADEWFLNAPGDVIDNRCNRPQAIRITLLARSRTVDSLLVDQTTNQMAAAEDSPQGPVDQFRHRIIRTTVYPRN